MNLKNRFNSVRKNFSSLIGKLVFIKENIRKKIISKEIKVWQGLFVIFILGMLIFIFFINIDRNCKNDQTCFLEATKRCRAATVEVEENGNIFTYSIIGKGKDSCIISVDATDINGNFNTVELFSGKQMICDVPKTVLQESLIGDVPGLIDYCNGELKEAMYELIISKIYGSIAQNLGEIILEIKKEI